MGRHRPSATDARAAFRRSAARPFRLPRAVVAVGRRSGGWADLRFPTAPTDAGAGGSRITVVRGGARRDVGSPGHGGRRGALHSKMAILCRPPFYDAP